VRVSPITQQDFIDWFTRIPGLDAAVQKLLEGPHA
jgi:hypothetical protein